MMTCGHCLGRGFEIPTHSPTHQLALVVYHATPSVAMSMGEFTVDRRQGEKRSGIQRARLSLVK